MNKLQLVDIITVKAGLSKPDALKTVNVFIEAVKEAIKKGEKVKLAGFGVFETRQRAPRNARNLRTGQIIQVPAKRVPVFRASNAFKRLINR